MRWQTSYPQAVLSKGMISPSLGAGVGVGGCPYSRVPLSRPSALG